MMFDVSTMMMMVRKNHVTWHLALIVVGDPFAFAVAVVVDHMAVVEVEVQTRHLGRWHEIRRPARTTTTLVREIRTIRNGTDTDCCCCCCFDDHH